MIRLKVVGIKINNNGRVLYYNPNNLELKINLTVIVMDNRGLQFAKVVDFMEVPDDSNYENVIRIATKKDYLQHVKNINDAKIALEKCKSIIKRDKLNMNVIDATYNFDKTQLLFRFLAEDRVDFRSLARELGAKFRTRIELRQIGVRDNAKEIGGLGPCGRLLCCSTFLTNFNTVSISMAKNQGLALNPTKINGVCGRLLCCLNYENEQYLEARKVIPEVGKKININGKDGKVIFASPLLNKYNVLVENEIVEVNKNDSEK